MAAVQQVTLARGPDAIVWMQWGHDGWWWTDQEGGWWWRDEEGYVRAEGWIRADEGGWWRPGAAGVGEAAPAAGFGEAAPAGSGGGGTVGKAAAPAPPRRARSRSRGRPRGDGRRRTPPPRPRPDGEQPHDERHIMQYVAPVTVTQIGRERYDEFRAELRSDPDLPFVLSLRRGRGGRDAGPQGNSLVTLRTESATLPPQLQARATQLLEEYSLRFFDILADVGVDCDNLELPVYWARMRRVFFDSPGQAPAVMSPIVVVWTGPGGASGGRAGLGCRV